MGKTPNYTKTTRCAQGRDKAPVEALKGRSERKGGKNNHNKKQKNKKTQGLTGRFDSSQGGSLPARSPNRTQFEKMKGAITLHNGKVGGGKILYKKLALGGGSGDFPPAWGGGGPWL